MTERHEGPGGCVPWERYRRLVEALEKIAREDYRGPRPSSALIAEEALRNDSVEGWANG